MNVALSTVKWKFALRFINNFVVFSPSGAKHFDHVKLGLTLKRDARVTMKVMKGNFATETIDYFGHILRSRSLEIAWHTTGSIRGHKAPRNIIKLKSLSLFAASCRRFVTSFARTASPLTEKRHALGRSTSQCGAEWERGLGALDTLHEKLISAQVWRWPYTAARGQLDTDACVDQVRCVLQQKNPDKTRTAVECWIRSLTSAERVDGSTKRQCLVIVWSMLLLGLYV